MSNNYEDEEKSILEIEDTTKYGEFVSSYFAWITLDGQKKRAKKLDEITKPKES